jgi:hypothetical protein
MALPDLRGRLGLDLGAPVLVLPPSGRTRRCPGVDVAGGGVSLRLVPVKFADAAAFVGMHHRHHRQPVGHKFSIGVANDDDVLVGVAIIGRPVARLFDDGLTLEVNRTATDGTGNANSMLYGAAWRATSALGYRRLITYTQAGESGASLRAAGWKVLNQLPARSGWTTPSRPRDSHGVDRIARTLWEMAS